MAQAFEGAQGQARRDAHAGPQEAVVLELEETDEADSEAGPFDEAGPRAPAAAALVVRGGAFGSGGAARDAPVGAEDAAAVT